MTGLRVALATYAGGPEEDSDLPLAVAAFTAAGHRAEVHRWDDPEVDWDAFDLVVVRSCWDYVERYDEFLAWADRVPRLRNPAAVLRWSVDKTYLRDLEAAGCPVVPTVWDPTSTGQLPAAQEWVVKPSVSAGAQDTARWTGPDDVLRHASELLAGGRTVLVQPYLPAVDRDGETALLHLGGAFSHAVRKGPLLRRGEGVRQDRAGREELGATTARPDQLEVARLALDTVRARFPDEPELLYARVDVVDGPDGSPLLLELELTEPSLFLPHGDGAAERLVRAVEAAAG
jgi:glutathione synthase/RimK-type ligase-like ATP-grasp enzyme